MLVNSLSRKSSMSHQAKRRKLLFSNSNIYRLCGVFLPFSFLLGGFHCFFSVQSCISSTAFSCKKLIELYRMYHRSVYEYIRDSITETQNLGGSGRLLPRSTAMLISTNQQGPP
jgi:hypothetical protein